MAAFATLPVRDVVAANALLWFWTTGPLISIGAHIPVIKAWGFEPTAMGFTWAKLNKNASFPILSERDFFFGGGLTTRKNCEFVVLCRRGSPKQLAKDVRELIFSPVRDPAASLTKPIAASSGIAPVRGSISLAVKVAKDGPSGATRRRSSIKPILRIPPPPRHFRRQESSMIARAEDIARALKGRRCGKGWVCNCPAHDDHHPSLSVAQTRDGKTLVKCWSGCRQDDVLDALRRQGLWDGKARETSQAGKPRPLAAERETSLRPYDPMKTWRNAGPWVHGSAADTYFETRGIKLSDDEASSLRFAPGLWHWPTQTKWPAMLARVALADGTDSTHI